MKDKLMGIAEYALGELKKRGADGADVYVNYGLADGLQAEYGEMSLMQTSNGASISIRALVGGRRGNYAMNGIDGENVDLAVKSAIEAAEVSQPDEAEIIAESFGDYDYELGPTEGVPEKLFDCTREFLGDCARDFPKIAVEKHGASFNHSYGVYANSNGSRYYGRGGSYSFGASVVARDGDKVTTGSGVGYEDYNLDKSAFEREYVRRILGDCVKQLDPVPMDGKLVGKLLLSPECFRSVLSTALSLGAADGPMIMGISPWIGKTGEKVASESLSVTCDPFDPRLIFPPRVSDGHILETQEIIKDGKLQSYMLSRYGALKTKLPRAKCTSNAIVKPGERSWRDILADIDDGLLLNSITGGSPAPNGDFSFVARQSFRIRGGEIGEPVNETMISGNFFDLLKNIVGVSRETVDDGCLMPWVAFEGVTISGK
ncbi:MAG: TldD/PmbA family protein [Oscillospiraceae bacterium]|jgi:PmbA protein|nr:TldD/PmbA family protein [Oscillospiraceae bacterium]